MNCSSMHLQHSVTEGVWYAKLSVIWIVLLVRQVANPCSCKWPDACLVGIQSSGLFWCLASCPPAPPSLQTSSITRTQKRCATAQKCTFGHYTECHAPSSAPLPAPLQPRMGITGSVLSPPICAKLHLLTRRPCQNHACPLDANPCFDTIHGQNHELLTPQFYLQMHTLPLAAALSCSTQTPHSRLLLHTLHLLSSPASLIYLALSLHHNPEEVAQFLRWAAEDGFTVSAWPSLVCVNLTLVMASVRELHTVKVPLPALRFGRCSGWNVGSTHAHIPTSAYAYACMQRSLRTFMQMQHFARLHVSPVTCCALHVWPPHLFLLAGESLAARAARGVEGI